MANVTGHERTVAERLTALGADRVAKAGENPRATIEMKDAPADSSHDRAVRLLFDVEAGRAPRLDLDATLGEGGMGIVHLATQVSVGRAVAVKTLRDEHRNAEAARRLLREAWTTGAVEHPNIVPVYDVALESDGTPRVVLKRVEGTDWATLLVNPEMLAELTDEEPAEWHIRTLMQVCNAVHYAHERGILHRDLKPENVMIGRFGEVYVVDWGIAVTLHDDADPRLPRARDVREIEGTPAYMAPEMVISDPRGLDVRTDVYLLGAILYEILTGAPPHDGPTLQAMLVDALQPVPRITRGAPKELADICARALSLKAEDRPESAEAFRAELVHYLRHRESMQLSYRAQSRLSELMDELSSSEAIDEVTIQHLYGECRFGFLTALEQWPDNEVAAGGHRVAVTAMAKHALDRRQLHAAKVHLSQLDPKPPELVARIAGLEAELAKDAERREELEAFEQLHDPRTGSRTRMFVGGVMGTLFILIPLVAHFILRARDLSPDPGIAILLSLALLPIALGLGYWARESIGKTLFNRRIYALVIFLILSYVLLSLGVMAMELPVRQGFPIITFTWFTAATVVCITMVWQYWPTAVACLAASAWLVHFPDAPLLILSITAAVFVANNMVLWMPMALQSAKSDGGSGSARRTP